MELLTTLATLEAAEVANLIQGGAIFAALIGVIATIFWSNRVARKRATLDLILSELLDPRQVALRSQFIDLLEGGDLIQHVTHRNSDDSETAARGRKNMNVLGVNMNIYEMIAVGINKKIMDEKAYKDWGRTSLVEDWLACKLLVMDMRDRTGHKVYYNEFEKLAKRWAIGDEKSKF